MAEPASGGNAKCALPSYERNQYFQGKLLTAADFEAEQQFFITKDQSAHHWMHGAGIVCGLEVKEVKKGDKGLLVELGEGVALDCCGRDIVVTHDRPAPSLVDDRYVQVEGQLAEGMNYLYLQYHYYSTAPWPALGKGSNCGEEACEYSRVRETYKVTVTQTAPKSAGDPFSWQRECAEAEPVGETDATTVCRELDLEYYHQKLQGCPECDGVPQVFLAVVTYDPDTEQVTIDKETTKTYLSIVHSNPMLYEVMCAHLADFDNPHCVTAEDVGALVSVNHVPNSEGNIDLVSPDKSINIEPQIDTRCINLSAATYFVLRYVGGDGQEGLPGEQLPCPLVVGVEDQTGHPQRGIDVLFTAEQADDSLKEAGGGGDAARKQITVATDDRGIASVLWTLGETAGCHQVEATLPKPPQGTALPLQFKANARQSNDPQTTWPMVKSIDWENDQPMPVGQLIQQGLVVVFSEPMHPATAGANTFIVTLELGDIAPRLAAGGSIERFPLPRRQSFILPGSVKAEKETWHYTLDSETAEALAERLKLEQEFFESNRVRCRVVLKGNAILAAEDARPLDGDVFGELRKDKDPVTRLPTTKLSLPSGDGNRGGDFESWFWLVGDGID